jgi:hypothetical protein
MTVTHRRALTPTEMLRKRAQRLTTARGRNLSPAELEQRLEAFVVATFPKRTLATLTDSEAESAIGHLDELIGKESGR